MMVGTTMPLAHRISGERKVWAKWQKLPEDQSVNLPASTCDDDHCFPSSNEEDKGSGYDGSQTSVDRERTRRMCCENHDYVKSNYYHCYSFRYDKPLQRDTSATDSCLTVTNVTLPSNVSSFNTGSSITKWSRKKPRLKSSLSSCSHHHQQRSRPNLTTDSTTSTGTPLANDNRWRYAKHDHKPPSPRGSAGKNVDDDDLCDESESDEVQMLCQLLNESNVANANANARRFNRGKIVRSCLANNRAGSKDTSASRRRKRRVTGRSISFGAPHSPQTVQVIRVDVIANVSCGAADEDDVTDKDDVNDDDGGGVMSARKCHAIDGSGDWDNGLDDGLVQCQKLELHNRL